MYTQNMTTIAENGINVRGILNRQTNNVQVQSNQKWRKVQGILGNEVRD